MFEGDDEFVDGDGERARPQPSLLTARMPARGISSACLSAQCSGQHLSPYVFTTAGMLVWLWAHGCALCQPTTFMTRSADSTPLLCLPAHSRVVVLQAVLTVTARGAPVVLGAGAAGAPACRCTACLACPAQAGPTACALA